MVRPTGDTPQTAPASEPRTGLAQPGGSSVASTMAGATQQAKGAADVVFGHCLAVVGDRGLAEDAARVAFLRAGPWRSTLLAHARHEALRRAEEGAGAPADDRLAPEADVTMVARALAFSRPPFERAVIDLRSRTGADRTALGRALGLPPTVAADRAAFVAEGWDHDLDAALLAYLGPGECDELAGVLGYEPADDDEGPVERPPYAPPAAVAGLLALAPAVAAHTAECAVCLDRRRAMASVRTLFTLSPATDTPPSVRAEARRSRMRRPVGPPPSIEPQDTATQRWIRLVAVAAAALLVAGTVTALVVRRDSGSTGTDPVGDLTKVARGPLSLAVVTTPLGPSATAIRIRNDAAHPVRWRAAPAAGWVALSPSEGTLSPGATAVATARPVHDSPEGDISSLLTITADDGTAVATELRWSVERAPDVQAVRDGCRITATVADDGDVSAVVLRVRNGADQEVVMTRRDDQWDATLPENPGEPVRWWVEAVDNRGNAGRTVDQALDIPATC